MAKCHDDTTPKYLSSDHDPLFQFHRPQANLRVLDIEEIKTMPYKRRCRIRSSNG